MPPTAAATVSVDWSDAERVYRNLLVIQWAENAFIVLLSIYFIYRMSRTSLIHPNMRVLFIFNLVLPYILTMTARICAQWNESEWSLAANSRIFTNLICMASRFVLSTAICPCSITVLTLAVERALATIFRRDYEVYGKSFAVAVNVLTYSCAAIYSTLSIVAELRDGFDMATDTRSCANDELHPNVLVRFWIVAGITCYVGLLLFLIVYRWNLYLETRDRWSDSAGALQTRFQHRLNTTIANALAPGVLPYAFLVLAGITIALYTVKHYDLSKPLYHPNIRVNFQLMYMLMDVYVLAFELLFLCQYPPLRNQLRRDLYNVLCCGWASSGKIGGTPTSLKPLPGGNVPNDAKAVGALYFKQLNDDWATVQKKRVDKVP